MKKALSVILAVTLLFLTACGGGIPKGMNKETYQAGKDALEIMQNYNSGKISKEDAKDRISVLRNRLEKLELSGTEDISNTSIELILQSFSINLDAKGDTFKDADKLKEKLGL